MNKTPGHPWGGGGGGSNKIQQYGGRFKNGENLGHNLTVVGLIFTAKNMFADIYGALDYYYTLRDRSSYNVCLFAGAAIEQAGGVERRPGVVWRSLPKGGRTRNTARARALLVCCVFFAICES